MSATTFVLDSTQVPRLAQPQPGPDGTARTVPYRAAKWFSGGGGLMSTAEDYARFCQMLLNGGELDGVQLLARKSVELMTSNHLPPDIANLVYQALQ